MHITIPLPMKNKLLIYWLAHEGRTYKQHMTRKSTSRQHNYILLVLDPLKALNGRQSITFSSKNIPLVIWYQNIELVGNLMNNLRPILALVGLADVDELP